jgi:hypothetical protein
VERGVLRMIVQGWDVEDGAEVVIVEVITEERREDDRVKRGDGTQSGC